MNVIEGFEELTPQQAFELSAKHLIAQGTQSGDQYMCAYRGFQGRKCAAGVFLTDEGASRCEYHGWEGLVADGKVPARNATLIKDLQRVHDGHTASEWPMQLIEVACKHELDAGFLGAQS